MNSLIRSGLNQAIGALHQLADSGCTVLSVTLESRNPVLKIEPPTSEFLRAAGAIKRRVTFHGQRWTTFAARVHGVQVEWDANENVTEARHASG